MKNVLVAAIVVITALSLSACGTIGKGKGKAPPPIVTNG